MSPTGEAVVVYKGPTPGYVFSRYRPVGGHVDGGGRGDAQQLPEHARDARTSSSTATGARSRSPTSASSTTRSTTTSAPAAPGARRTGRSTTTATRRIRSTTSAPWRASSAIRTGSSRPGRAGRRPEHDEIVVARLNGATWDLKVFKLTAGAVSAPQLAVNAAGEILVAADTLHGNVDDIYASIAPSLTAPWPDLALVSPAGSADRAVPRAVRHRPAGRRSRSAGACTAGATSAPR